MNRKGISGRVDQHTARGVVSGNAPETLTQPFMKARVEALEAVGGAAPGGGAPQPDFARQVQDQRQIRREPAESKPVQRVEIGERESFTVALVSERRIGKAVGHDPDPVCQRGLDQPDDVIVASCREQQCLADRVPALAVPLEEQPPDCLGVRRTARLASAPRRDAGALECSEKKARLGRLAGPLPAFDRDEPAARDGAQCRWPQTR